MANQQNTLIVEITGSADEIQNVLESIEGLVDQNKQVEIKAVTLRNE